MTMPVLLAVRFARRVLWVTLPTAVDLLPCPTWGATALREPLRSGSMPSTTAVMLLVVVVPVPIQTGRPQSVMTSRCVCGRSVGSTVVVRWPALSRSWREACPARCRWVGSVGPWCRKLSVWRPNFESTGIPTSSDMML